MANNERPEQDRSASTAPDFSLNSFFHDAYNRGIVSAAEERPREAAVTAIGTAVVATAAVYAAKSELVSGLFRGGATEEAGQLMMPATKSLATEGLPMRGASLDLTGRTAALSSESPMSLVFGGKTPAATNFDALLRETRPANNLGFSTFQHTAFPPGATAEIKATRILDTANGVTHTPFAAADTLEQKAARLMGTENSAAHTPFGAADTLGQKADRIMGTATGHGAGTGFDPFKSYDQSGYKFVPMRTLAADIRLGGGPTMTTTEGPSQIIFGDNSVQHIRFNSSATDAEKASLMLKAGFADLVHSDRLAYDAAGKTIGQSIGFNSQPIERFASIDELHENAIQGAAAYVDGNAAAANGYSRYLTERYGPMSAEDRMWGTHIAGGEASTESIWNATFKPATDTLISQGLPINALNRAVAANPSVLKAQPWLRGAAIRGGAEYMASRAEQTLPEGATQLVKDAWYGNQAKEMTPEVVNTVGAITLQLGEKACADAALIDKVANLVGPAGKPEDYIGAYNALKQGESIMAAMKH